MRNPRQEIGTLLRENAGILLRREHPALRHQLEWLVSTGELRAVLPGVYVSTEQADEFGIRARAAYRWEPNAVVSAEQRRGRRSGATSMPTRSTSPPRRGDCDGEAFASASVESPRI